MRHPAPDVARALWVFSGRETPVSGDELAAEIQLDRRVRAFKYMSERFVKSFNDMYTGTMTHTPAPKPNPTLGELKKHLVTDNDWTEEEFDQFLGYSFRTVNADGTTNLTWDEWEDLAMRFE